MATICVERTLAILKPDLVYKQNEIEDIILKCGFNILQKRQVQLSPEQASDFYAEHFGKPFFPSLVAYMSSGPVVALMLSRQHAVSYWRELLGPTNSEIARNSHPQSLRAVYGTDGQRNAFHGSDSHVSAEREVRFFFPESLLDPICVGSEAKDYLIRVVKPTLLRGLTQLCKEKPNEPIRWLSDWLQENNPYKPKVCSNSVIIQPDDY